MNDNMTYEVPEGEFQAEPPKESSPWLCQICAEDIQYHDDGRYICPECKTEHIFQMFTIKNTDRRIWKLVVGRRP